MNDELKKVIENSIFEVISGDFVYVKTGSIPSNNHFLIAQDKDEITVVTTEDRVKELHLIEKNKETYSLIALHVSVPFYSVGLLAAVSKTIAEAEMNILIVSTYSKDYILVKKEKLNRTKEILLSLGFQSKT